MNRRTWVLAGAGAAAVAAGAAWRLRGSSGAPAALVPAQVPAQAAAQTPALASAALSPAAQAFWQMSFPTPDGGTVVAAGLRGQPLLLNFWGTWCPPCIKEMPDLDAFAREHAALGWRVLGLAVDNPKAVREFLKRSPVGYLIGLAGFEGSDLARQLGNDKAGLPFTVAFDRRGAVALKKAGATTREELSGWAKRI